MMAETATAPAPAPVSLPMPIPLNIPVAVPPTRGRKRTAEPKVKNPENGECWGDVRGRKPTAESTILILIVCLASSWRPQIDILLLLHWPA